MKTALLILAGWFLLGTIIAPFIGRCLERSHREDTRHV